MCVRACVCVSSCNCIILSIKVLILLASETILTKFTCLSVKTLTGKVKVSIRNRVKVGGYSG